MKQFFTVKMTTIMFLPVITTHGLTKYSDYENNNRVKLLLKFANYKYLTEF